MTRIYYPKKKKKLYCQEFRYIILYVYNTRLRAKSYVRGGGEGTKGIPRYGTKQETGRRGHLLVRVWAFGKTLSAIFVRKPEEFKNGR